MDRARKLIEAVELAFAQQAGVEPTSVKLALASGGNREYRPLLITYFGDSFLSSFNTWRAKQLCDVNGCHLLARYRAAGSMLRLMSEIGPRKLVEIADCIREAGVHVELPNGRYWDEDCVDKLVLEQAACGGRVLC